MNRQSKMKKLAMVGVGVAMIGSILGTTLVASAQSAGGSTQTPAPGGGAQQQRQERPGHGRPGPKIEFENRLGGQWQYKDADGNVHTVASIPGTVVSVSGNKVTIKPNDGSANKEFTFDTTDKERLAAHIASLKEGDKVVVTTLDGVAQSIHKAPQRPSAEEIKERVDKAKERADEMRKKMEERRGNRGSGGATTTGTSA
jgi:preprotein translocase subunit YajC